MPEGAGGPDGAGAPLLLAAAVPSFALGLKFEGRPPQPMRANARIPRRSKRGKDDFIKQQLTGHSLMQQ